MPDVAIGFDFDHTLGIDNKLETVAFEQVARRLAGSSGLTLDADRARTAIGRELGDYRMGGCRLDDAIALAFDDAVGEGAGDRRAVNAFRALAVELAPQYVQPLPGALELLRSLDASGVPYAILTNGWNPLQQCKADCIGFNKPVFVSDDLGVRKPDVHAFNVLCDCFALAPDRIWYVGDDPKTDILGALGAGIRAVWFDWEGKQYPTDMPGPTAIVQQIGDVLNYLE